MIKEKLQAYMAQFLALSQNMQMAIGLGVAIFLGVLWQMLSAPAVPQAPLYKAQPPVTAAASVPATQTAAATPAVTNTAPTPPPEPKVFEKQANIPVGTTAITKLKLVKALPQGLVSDSKLKADINNQYQTKFDFPLTEDKMVRFSEAALLVENTNRRWDLQLAAAENDATTIEYLKMSRAESVKAVESTQGITMAEYLAIYNLTATDDQFNRIAIAYKNLVANAQKKQALKDKLAEEQKNTEQTKPLPPVAEIAPPQSAPNATTQPVLP